MRPSHLKYYLCIDVTKSFIPSGLTVPFACAFPCDKGATQFGQHPKIVEQGDRSLHPTGEPATQ